MERAFSSKAKDFGDQIGTDIKEMFTEKLKTVEWMDKGTTKLAIEKVHKIVQKSEYFHRPYEYILVTSKGISNYSLVGYPTTSPDIMNPEALRSFYSPVSQGPPFPEPHLPKII